MRINKLTLPGKVRRRDRPHTGKVEMPASNERWCSDGLNIRCWNGDLVRMAFALDCHDREVPGHVATARPLNGGDIRLLLDRALWGRFGETTLKAPITIQWLNDNEGIYTSLETTTMQRILASNRSRHRPTAPTPMEWLRPSSTPSNATTSPAET